MSSYIVAVHCGAGFHSQANEPLYAAVICRAIQEAENILKNGGTSEDAVVAATTVLEDDPLTNAGRGSNLTIDGEVEVDACLASGDGEFAAVGAVPNMKNPTQICAAMKREAKKKMLLGRIPPIFLCGEGANQWAKEKGLGDEAGTAALKTPKSIARWQNHSQRLAKATEEMERRNASSNGTSERKENSEEEEEEEVHADTVGVVCIDSAGTISSSVSSGGISLKRRGRIGEAAIIGCGTTCSSEPLIGITCTGSGEDIMRLRLAERVHQILSDNQSDDATDKIEEFIREKTEKCDVALGFIALRKESVLENGDDDDDEEEEEEDFSDEEIGAGSKRKRDENVSDVDRIEIIWAHTTHSLSLGFKSSRMKSAQITMSRLSTHETQIKSIAIGVKKVDL